jgi:hypothetical protein
MSSAAFFIEAFTVAPDPDLNRGTVLNAKTVLNQDKVLNRRQMSHG